MAWLGGAPRNLRTRPEDSAYKCRFSCSLAAYPRSTKMSSSSLLLFVLVPLILLPVAQMYGNKEVDALSAFKAALDDPEGALSNWDASSADPCDWIYVTCESMSVTKIELQKQGLTGQLVPELADLTNLRYLGAFGNNLSGSIPVELGSLSKLVAMDLSNNSLTGSLPDTLSNLQSLVFLILDHNILDGPVPTQYATMPALRELSLAYNSLSGVVGPAFDKFGAEYFAGNPGLCGPAVDKPCP